jgi:hypothetical protein
MRLLVIDSIRRIDLDGEGCHVETIPQKVCLISEASLVPPGLIFSWGYFNAYNYRVKLKIISIAIHHWSSSLQ